MINNELYKEDTSYVADLELPWEKLEGKNIVVAGASGLIGSFLIDVLMEKDCHIYAICRDYVKAANVFGAYLSLDHKFDIICQNINQPFRPELPQKADFVIHLASNTHPVSYALDPIGTITSNVIGTNNMLDFASNRGCRRFLFASSNEIYGENKGDTEFFNEEYLGYIDCNTLRAGYPEGKRCGEALCQAYKKQKDLDVVIARLTRSIGPTVKKDDSKASSQFLNKALTGEDIVLKSNGEQYYSYSYVADSIAGILTVLLKGENGEAYNIADEKGDIRLKDFAAECASWADTKVVFDLPDETEAAGFSKTTKARLCGDKLKSLGWNMKYSAPEAINRTLTVLADKTKG